MTRCCHGRLAGPRSVSRWHQRAAAVSLIHSTRQHKNFADIQRITEMLLTSDDDMVQKGLGWLLREAAKAESDQTVEYLMTIREHTPRLVLRTACETLPVETRERVLETKQSRIYADHRGSEKRKRVRFDPCLSASIRGVNLFPRFVIYNRPRMNLSAIQAALRDSHNDCWLFYDHHHRDPIAYHLLGLPEKMMVTRRWFYVVPAEGEPVKLVHRIESHHLDSLPGKRLEYSAWQELWQNLEAMLKPYHRVVMQYSPNNQIPYISLVDAGMLELVRSFGKEIVSSANLVARFEATLTDAQMNSHSQGPRRHRQDYGRLLPGSWASHAQRRHA